jgi:hypothetical protein
MFGTENYGFCVVMKSFLSGIAVATELKKDKIRVQNAYFAGKSKSHDEFLVR